VALAETDSAISDKLAQHNAASPRAVDEPASTEMGLNGKMVGQAPGLAHAVASSGVQATADDGI